MQYPDAARSGSLDSVMAFFADDVRVFDHESRVDGAAALRSVGEQFFGQNTVTRLAYAPSETVAHDSGTVVYQFGYYTEDFTPKAGGDTTNARANFVMRWVRNGAGQWVLHRVLAVRAPDQSAPAATAAPVAPVAGNGGDAESVKQRMNEYIAAYQKNDAAAVKAFWAADARLAEPGIEINDKTALDQGLDGFLANNRATIDLTTEEIFLHDQGSVAYQFGYYSETVTGRNPGSYRMHFMARWKKDTSGQWLIDRFYATPRPR